MKSELIKITDKLPLIIFYQGNYEDAPTESIIGIVENNEKLISKKGQLRKLMFLCVEAIQNIQRYSAHKDSNVDSSLIFSDGNTYQVLTQNLISNENISELKARLDAVVSKTKEELDLIYITQIDSDEKTTKGAGLGLIEMARKSDNNLFYHFENFDDQHSLFNLCFAIPIEKENFQSVDFANAINIQKALNQLFKNNKSSLFYGGDFSNNFILSIINLLLTKSTQERRNANKKTHHILIELIQNIKRHSKSDNQNKPPKLIIEWGVNNTFITTHNLAPINNVQELQKKVVDLNALNKEELIQESKDILTDLEATNGLGLVDIANLIYPNRMEIKTNEIDDKSAELLFTIKVNNE